MMSASASRLNLKGRPVAMGMEAPGVFLRRRRSRSNESRKSKKENEDIDMPGKKRKTQALEISSSKSWLEGMSRQARKSWAKKDSRRKSSQNIKAEISKPLAFDRHSRPDSNMSSDDEAYETSKSTLASMPASRSGPVSTSQLTRPQIPQRQDDGAKDVQRLVKQAIELQREIDAGKASLDAKNLALEALRQELSSAKKINRKQGSQIEKLKTSGKKAEEIIANIQTNLQCQICLELMVKPYALAPCGHVLCQGCLQEWFKTAPDPNGQAHLDDLDNTIPPLFRRKTCPCCRGRVLSRPLKLYILKSITALVAPETDPRDPAVPVIIAPGDAVARVQEDTIDADFDPWAGIFPEEIDMSDEDFNDDEDLENELDADAWSLSGSESHYGYGSSSDEEDTYTGHYVHPPWAPPILDIPRAPGIQENVMRMLRRGATMQMIERFSMWYEAGHGLMASLEDGLVEICLGWNIELLSEDEDGSEFMEWIQDDIETRPERWEMHQTPNRDLRQYWRLVREDGEDDDGPAQSWFSDDDE